MGIAVGPRGLAIGTQRHVWDYRNQPDLARKLPPAGKHDACFLPRRGHVTGDIRVHELAFAGDELWLVNTRFSCLSVLDNDHSFVPRWRPPFVTALAPEDRCHLNGLAVVDGRPRYVTALGETDTPQGWRERRADGGCLIDIDSGETVARGLSMPHSPRLHAGRLSGVRSGKGELGFVDVASGRMETVTRLPGFTRGLAFAGPYAFVGLSQVRESNIFGGIPLTERVQEALRRLGRRPAQRQVGRLPPLRGDRPGNLRPSGLARYPLSRGSAEPDSDLTAGAFVLPADALADVPAQVGGAGATPQALTRHRHGQARVEAPIMQPGAEVDVPQRRGPNMGKWAVGCGVVVVVVALVSGWPASADTTRW